MVVIETTSFESDYTNNYDKATTIIGDFANVWTRIDCPPYAEIGKLAQCSVKVGNNGNIASTGNVLKLWL